MSAIRKKAKGKEIALEMTPVSGGARRRPKKPMVEISAIAMPDGIALQRPVRLQQSGTTALAPHPTIANPMSVIGIMPKGSQGAPTIKRRPTVIAHPQTKRILKMPMRLTKRSIIKRPVTMVQR